MRRVFESVLVILANFNDTAAPSYTPAQAQQVMTTNAYSVANYYSDVSYGQQLLNVTVTSAWVTIQALPSGCTASTSVTTGRPSAAAKA